MKTLKAIIEQPSYDLHKSMTPVPVFGLDEMAKPEDIENIDWEMVIAKSNRKWTSQLASAYVKKWLADQKNDAKNKEYVEVLDERRKFLKSFLMDKLEDNLDFFTLIEEHNLSTVLATGKEEEESKEQVNKSPEPMS